jgi:putative membrane protein
VKSLLRIVLNAVALLVAAHLVPGIHYQPEGLLLLLLAGLVMGVVNLFVKPLAVLLSLPLIVITLGLFYLVVNGLMLQLVAWILPDLTIAGCVPAVLGGIVIGVFNWAMQALFFDREGGKGRG